MSQYIVRYRLHEKELSKLNFMYGLFNILLLYILDFAHNHMHMGSLLPIKTTLLNHFQLNLGVFFPIVA